MCKKINVYFIKSFKDRFIFFSILLIPYFIKNTCKIDRYKERKKNYV